MTIRIQKYSQANSKEWNEFIKKAKNATFLFDRGYMDYHKDLFIDHSLMVYEENKLIALFPANEKESVIQSHGGLSYGGLIYGTKLRAQSIIDIINELCLYYKKMGFEELHYKCIPEIYCCYPSGEVSYALFLKRAKLYRRDLSSTILIEKKLKLSKGRRWLLARAKKNDIKIQESLDFETFFTHYNQHLNEKYNVSAVHAHNEMSLLQSRFPENIKLIIAVDSNEAFLGGIILYCTPLVIHAQYIHFTDSGKEIGAFDLLMNQLFEDYKDRTYFDFGISTEQDGMYLNQGLLSFKESFGGRATLCNFYKISLR